MTTTISNRLSNSHPSTLSNDNNEEDQLNRINLQALQNRDPYISKIVDQAQRVCVYKFIAEKREWERKDLEGTLFVYERMCEPYHGFVILSTVSRETFVQIIKPSMEFKHTPTYEAFLQYKVDVGDIYGIWFISKNDCPRVTECLKNLTEKAKELEQSKLTENTLLTSSSQKSNTIISLLNTAQDKFQESKRKQDTNDTSTTMPAVLLRLFSTQDTTTQSTMNSDERGEELKKTLGISGKPALSVTELEKQFLQPSSSQERKTPISNNENMAKPVPIAIKSQIQTSSQSISSYNMNTNSHSVTMNSNPFSGLDSIPPNNNNNRLMTPAEFQRLHITQSPVLVIPTQNESSCTHGQYQTNSSINNFSRDNLRHLLVDMLQNDDEFVTGLHNAYLEKQINLHRLYS